MAFQDGLTGLFNRAAYNREIERLEDGDVGELFCVCADINNLKRINDCLLYTSRCV